MPCILLYANFILSARHLPLHSSSPAQFFHAPQSQLQMLPISPPHRHSSASQLLPCITPSWTAPPPSFYSSRLFPGTAPSLLHSPTTHTFSCTTTPLQALPLHSPSLFQVLPPTYPPPLLSSTLPEMIVFSSLAFVPTFLKITEIPVLKRLSDNDHNSIMHFALIMARKPFYFNYLLT